MPTDKVRAFCSRFRVVSAKEKLRMLAKLMLRPFGVKKCLYLGGYSRAEDLRQLEEDREIARRIKECQENQEKKVSKPIKDIAVGKYSKDKLTSVSEIQGEPQTSAMPEALKKVRISEIVKEPVKKVEQASGLNVSENIRQLKELLQQKNSYLALYVDNLDKGGLEEVVRTLVLEYLERELPTRVLCAQGGGSIAENLKQCGVEVVIFHGQKEQLEAYLQQSRPLLVNAHYGNYFLEVFHQLEIPVVETIHNMYVFLTEEQLVREREKAERIDRYIAVSQKAKEVFLGKLPTVPEQKVVVIGNAVRAEKEKNSAESGKEVISNTVGDAKVIGSKENTGKMAQTSHGDIVAIRQRWGIPTDAFVFLSAGSIDARKNQIGILRAWDIAHSIMKEKAVLVFAGAGTDYEYECKVERMVKDRGLTDSVIFTGHCTEMAALMSASDAFVLDSYYEGWSMAATEALLCGLPLIHSDCGSGRELVAEGLSGILVDNPLKDIATWDSVRLYDAMHAGINENIEQTAHAMLNMYEQREDWKKHRQERINHAQQSFSIEHMIQQYIAVYMDETDVTRLRSLKQC